MLRHFLYEKYEKPVQRETWIRVLTNHLPQFEGTVCVWRVNRLGGSQILNRREEKKDCYTEQQNENKSTS